MTNPSVQIEEFRNHIQALDQDSLVQIPDYVDIRAFNPRNPVGRLRLNGPKTAELQQKYSEVQEAFFDFAGRCLMCDIAEKHVHSVQGPGVFELEGCPGLYLYPKLLGNHLVYKELINTLLHHELANRRNQTNLHEQYHVTYPDASNDGADSSSYFATGNSKLRMQPRLQGQQDWMTTSITTREFVAKLHWLKLVDTERSNIKTLFQSILPYEIGTGTAYITSSIENLRFEQDEAEHSPLIDVSLGCDGIVVVGLEGTAAIDPEESPKPEQLNMDSFFDFNQGTTQSQSSASNLRDEEPKPEKSDAGEGKQQPSTSCSGSAVQLAALHLRSTDVLVFTGRSRKAWHGVAKVLEGSSPHWEQHWPCWEGSDDAAHADDSWKGCMKGRRIDLVFQ